MRFSMDGIRKCTLLGIFSCNQSQILIDSRSSNDGLKLSSGGLIKWHTYQASKMAYPNFLKIVSFRAYNH